MTLWERLKIKMMNKDKDIKIHHIDRDELMKSRKQYNDALLYSSSMYAINIKYRDVRGIVEMKTKEHPELRFGQVICNDVCPDYRDENPCEKTKLIMKVFFTECKCDPFYEEPETTFKRIKVQSDKITQIMIDNIP